MERTENIFRKFANVYRIFFLLSVLVFARIVYLQFFDKSLEGKDIKLSFREVEIPASRGDILAHDGKTLATSVPFYIVRMDCTVSADSVFNSGIDSLAICLSQMYKDKSYVEYKKLIVNGRKNNKRYLTLNKIAIDYSDLSKVKRFPIFRKGGNKGGIIIEEIYKRNNPYGRKAYRTIGFMNSQGVGTGIESSKNYYLKGVSGKQIEQRREGGEWVPINGSENIPPQDGYDIRTTIDIDIQEATETALKEQLTKGYNIEGATAVVMETKTGAIRAIANLKNDGRGGFDESLNYAIGQATEPGSVLKLVTLISVLEEGYVDLNTPIDGSGGNWVYKGQRVTDGHHTGLTTVKGAFAISSNVCFAKLATGCYENRIKDYVDRLNNMKIGERFNIDILGEAPATIYGEEFIKSHPGILASMGFGYGLLITPLHTLTFYNAIANNGKMMKPYFIESYERNGQVIKSFSPTVISGAICSKESVRKAKEALRAVVTEGTGKMMRNDNYEISGKTGTARIAFEGGGYERNGMRRYQASFCGFFPSENPLYSVIVVLYSAPTAGNFYGATQAGPPFKYIADFIYANTPEFKSVLNGKQREKIDEQPIIAKGRGSESYLVINNLTIGGKNKLLNTIKDKNWIGYSNDTNSFELKRIDMYPDSLVDVTDMGLKDALFVLENQGYKVNFSGEGRVISQEPPPGTHIQKNSVVHIVLSKERKK